MKKINLSILVLLLFSINAYSQFTEGFESTTGPDALPSTNWTLGSGNWAVFDNGIGTQRWDINSTISTPVTVYQGVNAAYINRENIGQGNTSENYLATPAVLIPTNGELHFFTRMFTSGNQGTIYQIKVAPATASQTDVSSYSLVQQWTEPELIVPTSNFNIYTEKTVNFSAFAGQFVFISFVKIYTQPTTSIDGDRWLIDNVGINAQCLAPTGLTFSAITVNGATLNWINPNGSGTTWEIEVVPASGTPTGTPTHTTTALPYVVTGLLPNTAYNYYVRAICTSGFSSAWSTASATFTTGTAPPVCGGNFVDSGGVGGNYANNENSTTTICPTNPGDQVTVTFTSFNVQNGSDLLKVYDGNNASSTLLATLTGTTLPPAFTSSAASGCLTFVFTSNGTTTATGWASNVTCAPAPTCSLPTAVTNSTVTFNSAIISWTQPANPDSSVATAWQILALTCGSPAPTASSTGFVSASSNPFTLTGLLPTTCYDIYVRAVCSASDSSAWSRIASSFTTQAAPPVCGGNFVDSGGTTGSYSNSENTTTTICPTNVGDLVTVTFTSFSLESCCDSLKIYDGNSTSATLLGTYTGATLPPAYTSTAANGCLTFLFTSDSSVTQAGWIANITCAPAPTCRKPTSLTNSTVNATSAILSWTQPANPNSSVATAWQVLALTCGSPAPTATSTGFVNATSNPFTLTGLTATTCYDVYVRAVCSASDSSTWSSSTTFTTQALPPVCGGNFVDSGGTTGNYSNSENTTTTICPTTTGDLVTVTFTAFSLESCCDSLRIYDGSSTSATLLGTYTGTTLPPTYTSTSSGGCLTFLFTSDSSVTQTGWIANVTCAPAPTCSKPLTLTNSTVTATSVILSWTQPANPNTTVATAWQVLALTCGSPVPTAASTGFVIANSNPFTLTGLSPTTCYDVYVRAVCSASDRSAWSALTTFTTQALPPVCGGNFVDSGGTTANYSNNENITTTICPINAGDLVTVTFTSFSMESCCDRLSIYDGSNAAAPLLGTYTGTTLPPAYTSSTPNGCLTFVFTSDSSVVQTGWIANVTCAPAPTCSKPINLTNTNVLSTSAVLSWTQPANPNTTMATAWQVLALSCGSPTPTATSTGFVNASTNPFTLTGLTPLTCYDVYVRAVCSASDSSAWSALTTFTTQALPPVCGGNFVDTGGPAGNYNNNANITTTICPTNTGDLVTVQFTSFNVEMGFDQLRIYDGDNASAPLLGTYTGTVIPPTYTSNAASGCLTFVFTSDGTGTQPGWTSNVTCAPAPLCRKPTNLTTSTVTANSVNLAWTNVGNATSWQVLALACGSPIPDLTTTGWVSASTNPFVLNGLFPNTCYTIYVRGNCGTDGVSAWSNSVTITTQIAPPGCGGNFLDSGALSNYANNSNIGTLICPSSPTDKVTVTFTSFDTEANTDFLKIYNGNSAAAPLIGTYSGTNLPPSATSSAANGCLYFVFTSNNLVTQTGWSSNITCAPAVSCPNPLGVTSTTVVTTTSQLSWIEAGSATSWQVLTLPCGSPPPTNSSTGWISTTANPYTVTGLTPNCCNQYYVRSVCSGSATSNWTPGYLNQAGSYVVWSSASGASTLSGTFPGGTVAVTFTGTGNPVTIDSPAGVDTNLVVTGNNTFSTSGPSDNPPSQRLTFTFSTPVIIDRYSMADIDLGTWDDSFNFVGVTFTSTTSTNVNTTVTGAVASPSSGGNNTEYASWFSSTTPVTSFSLNYLTTGGLTHAYLAYALKVFMPCPIPLATLNVSVNSPTVCQGTPANVIATPSTPGNYNYTWTVPTGATNPGNVASFFTNVAGVYSVIITDTGTGTTSPSASGTVTINTPIAAIFNSIPAICNGATAPSLPSTSIEGFTGNWSPSVVNNTLTGTYTFTPTAGQCASSGSVTITVNDPAAPTFDTFGPYCTGSTVPNLPTTSNNSITGTWSPAIINNTQSATYTFTPNSGQCASSTTKDVTVIQTTTPTFLSPAPICTGNTAPTLPLTSVNGITGTWSPSVVDNTQTATYTFTPNAGQCATTTTMSVTVYQDCSFGSFANAVWLTNCEDSNFFNTVGSGTSIIGPAQNIFPNTDFGTYISNSNTFKLRGAELKTFKSATANVCSARLNYRIYPQSGTPGAFTVLNLPFFEDCSAGTFPSGGPCNPGDQKWQKVLSDAEFPVDLTAFPAGDYILEVYYDITGDVNSTSQCDDTIYINNNGDNFIATYTLQESPTYTSVNPTICNAADGSITIENLAPSTTYTLTYTHDSLVVGPLTINSNNLGQYTLSGLTVGTYANFNYEVNGCTFASADIITLTVQSIVPIASTDPLTCNGTTGTITISNLVPNQAYAVTYSDDTVVVGPTTMTADATGQIVLTGLNAGVYTNFNLTTTYCTATSTQVVTLNDPAPPVVTVNSSTVCIGQSATVTATPQVPGIYNYVWTVPTGFTNPGNVASFNTNVAGTYTVVITPLGTFFCNGGFESPTTTGAFPNMFNENIVNCWDTTAADGIMEFWPPAGFEGVFAYQGNQFIEINGNSTATVFQDFTTYPGALLQISFAHRGRQGTDVVGLEIGPNGGPYTSLGNFTDSTAWALHNLTYSVPTWGGNNYTIRFVSVSSTGGDPTVGNFLDAVSVNSGECSSSPASGTVTLLPTVTLNLTSANNNQTVCINTTIAAITYASVNATNVTVTGLPTGVNGIFNSGTNVFTISGTPTQSGTFPYTVSTVGGCNVVTLNGTLVVNSTVAATFTPITICRGDAVNLPLTSIQGYTGTWNPATVDNTQTGTYIFTPTAGQCATNGSLTITVNQPILSTFAFIPAICNGDLTPVLPATSLEGFTGTWSPSTVSNTQSATYTFTPTAGQCALAGSVSVTVNQKTTPTFNAIATLCTGETAPSLPSSSLEGITGNWTPSVIDNTTSGTYIFVPNAGQCANNGALSVTVQSAFDFELTGKCIGDDFFIEVTAVNNTIDINTANFVWYNSNNQTVGNNSSTFNVTEYLNSTTPIEEMPITFSVTVTNADGCYKTEPITLTRIFCGIQKGISVNNDGDNEFFDLTLLNVKHLSIFNRYGMKVYTKGGYINEWKGQSDSGDELPDGTYYYVIDFNDNLPAKTGWIYINREN
ncbi:CUB domain-containing protein [Flavobacterium sp.]|uniref:CUB domain-containing protein n=1 Tax=Flavobacterium sp. TaxID=239 RepID=UPI0025F473CC|nr:CUB domain-containing protein [Flavobacterium sp.]